MALFSEILNLLLIYAKDTLLLVFGILGGGIVSLYFFRKGLSRPELSCSLDQDRLVWAGAEVRNDLEIFYHGIRVHDPRRVNYYIWNSCNKIIEGSTITAADPLRIGGDGENSLLIVQVIKQSRQVINAAVSKVDQLEISLIIFDFLEPRDEFVVECFYDKKSQPLLGEIILN